MLNFIGKAFFTLLIVVIFSLKISAQSPAGVTTEGQPLSFPWAGGINSVQFGAVDLNNDGIKDLVVFDRQGNRLMCFVNKGTHNSIDYTYVPRYSRLFPQLFDWAEFVDYNRDGKTDIFTYSPGWAGIIVYKNISAGELKFKRVVYPYLTSYQGGGYVNIFVTYADYPAIVDIDGDGDLDILNFWGLGSFVEMQKNLSMEKYGNADSLVYEKTEYCWGHFAESDESNALFLDTCVGSNTNTAIRKNRHTGSTFLMMDFNNNGVKDLLLGDVDFPGLFKLTNGGTPENAQITAFDTLFPNYDTSVRLFSMPAAAYIDVNNDGKKDLLVSPFDPSPFVSENKHSVWLYLNKGKNNNPHFELFTKDFLQSQMIDAGSGANVVFCDWDKDGLTDILLGNYGFYLYSYYQNYTLHSVYHARLSWYKNIGTATKPEYQRWDNNLGGLDTENLLGIFPAVADLDNDGDNDLLVGNANGKLLYVRNDGDHFTIVNRNYFGIDVGEYSTPQLFDLDNDGLVDLIIGEKGGNLNYYHNDGTINNPDFRFVTDSLGKVNVTDNNISYNGYSTPCFYRKSSGETVLAVGSEQGNIYFFTNIDGNLNGRFTENNESGLNNLLDTSNVDYDRGMRTSVSIGDVNGDGKPDMIVGNFSGGIEFFNAVPKALQEVPPFTSTKIQKLMFKPVPAFGFTTVIFPFEIRNPLISLYSIDGKKINETSFSGSYSSLKLDLQPVKSGIYFVEVQANKVLLSGKLLIK